MTILIACEQSGAVRDEFTKLGYDAVSCDLLPSDTPGKHYQGDVRDILFGQQWDGVIAFPPCTYLTVTGNKWFKPEYAKRFPNRAQDRQDAIRFFMMFFDAPSDHIEAENPVGVMSTVWREPDQIIHPYMFGDAQQSNVSLVKKFDAIKNIATASMGRTAVSHLRRRTP